MSLLRVLGLLLIGAGVFGLVYHHFSFTRETHEAKLGPLELSVARKQDVDVPQWAAIGGIVIGAGLLLAGGTRR